MVPVSLAERPFSPTPIHLQNMATTVVTHRPSQSTNISRPLAQVIGQPISTSTSVPQQSMPTPSDILCCGFPNELAIFLNYTRALRFDNKPDYPYLRKLFRDLSVREGYQCDYIFDWSVQRSVQDNGHCPGPNKSGADVRREYLIHGDLISYFRSYSPSEYRLLQYHRCWRDCYTNRDRHP